MAIRYVGVVSFDRTDDFQPSEIPTVYVTGQARTYDAAMKQAVALATGHLRSGASNVRQWDQDGAKSLDEAVVTLRSEVRRWATYNFEVAGRRGEYVVRLSVAERDTGR